MTDCFAKNVTRLAKLAKQYGLTGHFDELRKTIRPSFSVVPAKRKDFAFSRFGGLPDAPPAFTWPRTDYGFLHFVAQIKLNELPKHADDLPRSGYLLFFASGEGSVSRLFWYPRVPRTLKPVVPPELPDFTFSVSESPIFKPKPVRFTPSFSLPPIDPMHFDDYDTIDQWMDLVDDFNPGDSRLLGYSYYDPGNYGLAGGFKKWDALLQVDSFSPCEDMLWSDNGKLAFFVRHGCIKRRAFGRSSSLTLGAG